ncbi:MAG: DUF1254 domain-containing protein [Hyphomonadaceae bacterium]|nr:DUF1254 domain-containing protein [Hyphomonadaceae bacterium]
MRDAGKYVWTAIVVALLAHFAFIHAVPRVMMWVALDRVSAEGARYNTWTLADRVTPLSRTIVRPSPDFAYSACAYDLSNGPVVIAVAPWDAYWSLSLYADNSDNFFVIDDREARQGAEITLIRRGRTPPEESARVVESPTTRGIALIRRLAPDLESYNAAAQIAEADVCAPQ